MPTLETPLWMQGGTYTADQDGSLLDNLWVNEGVINVGDYAVSQRAAGTNMSVDVASGVAIVTDDNGATPGKYLARHLSGPTNVALTTAPGTGQSRIDLIVIRVRDNAEDAGGNNDFILDKVTGTAATTGSQVAPALPNSCLLLAQVSVGPNVSTIVNANITDQRRRAFLNSGVEVCTSGTRPASPWAGMAAYETDTGTLIFYDGTAWRPGAKALPVHLRAYHTAAFNTLANTISSLVPNTVDYDVSSSYSAGTITAPYGGYLAVSMHMEVTATAAGQFLQSFVYNGATQIAKGSTGIAVGTGNVIDTHLATTVKVTQGDQITFRYNCSAAIAAGVGRAILYVTADGEPG